MVLEIEPHALFAADTILNSPATNRLTRRDCHPATILSLVSCGVHVAERKHVPRMTWTSNPPHRLHSSRYPGIQVSTSFYWRPAPKHEIERARRPTIEVMLAGSQSRRRKSAGYGDKAPEGREKKGGEHS